MDSRDEREVIQIGEYLQMLWRFRWAVLATTAAFGVAAVVSSRGAPLYEANVKIIMARPRPEAATPVAANLYFQAMLTNASVATRIVQEFGLDKPPYNITPKDLVTNNVSIETRDVHYGVRLRLPSPDVAQIANTLAEHAVELSRDQNKAALVLALERSTPPFEQARGELQALKDRLQASRKRNQLELVEDDINIFKGRRRELADVTIRIEAQRAVLAETEQQLGKQERQRTVPRAVDAAPAGAGTATPRLRGDVLDPFINPTYEFLEQQVTSVRADLAGLERRKSALENALKAGPPLMNELVSKRSELAALEAETATAQAKFNGLEVQYRTAQAQVSEFVAPLEIIDKALPPTRPVSNLPRNVVIAATLGFMLSAIVVLALQVFGVVRLKSPSL
jgi:uncharacterized protein involved in exopolysaccharide biosynthesis